MGKYKFALLILAIGLFLMSFSGTKSPPEPSSEQVLTQDETLEHRLGSILSRIDGVGKVEVLLTEAGGKETIYQTDTNTSADGALRTETVTTGGCF